MAPTKTTFDTDAWLETNIWMYLIFPELIWLACFYFRDQLKLSMQKQIYHKYTTDQFTNLPICHSTSFGNLFITNPQCMPIYRTTFIVYTGTGFIYSLPTRRPPHLWLFCIYYFNQIKIKYCVLLFLYLHRNIPNLIIVCANIVCMHCCWIGFNAQFNWPKFHNQLFEIIIKNFVKFTNAPYHNNKKKG